ncbi:PadR family transcriptional regulator [Corallococcus sp. AB004]|uniref:PadR family transcriptional regulator n=1 Tax=Corallococcus exiguus TaxID=83462 RepID=UPI000EA00D1F|nr:helix-turn-helix transcriptional regulator [Corallococcus exiguus]NPC72302.1 PadR family transcriptional regulator [Corallococcus exiguus]NRD45670.1 helix-turn-helix transcriptional regulator [Corallococcus exiguus]RKI39874.1 PadR family transcriptional regulator [Corallococcus sp. AB004]
MPRTRALSNHARSVLAALLDAGADWSHGYELCRIADVKSGTLYPLLIRLEAQGYLEAEWQQPAEGGRPPRHAYRLTQTGVQLARDNPADRKVAARSVLRGATT